LNHSAYVWKIYWGNYNIKSN